MKDLSVLIKPCSGSCNMSCEYCFYNDLSEHREIKNYGIMATDTLEVVIKKSLEQAEHSCTFAFQGGEPTLAGVSFFEKCVELQKKYNHGIRVENVIQTNGYGLNEEWAAFFQRNHFLVGVSVDGIMRVHNKFRKGKQGQDSFLTVMDNIQMLKKHGVSYNILTVVTKDLAAKTQKVYEFYKKNSFFYLQFIPCLEPLGGAYTDKDYLLTAEQYGRFLIELFDLWYLDVQQGTQPYIRMFENYINILLGMEPYACDQKGVCSCQYVIEADGSVYPCDFYVSDEYKIGNLVLDSYEEIKQNYKKLSFQKHVIGGDCGSCRYARICRGGCKRHYVRSEVGYQNYYCKSYKMFFEHALRKMQGLAQLIRQNVGGGMV